MKKNMLIVLMLTLLLFACAACTTDNTETDSYYSEVSKTLDNQVSEGKSETDQGEPSSQADESDKTSHLSKILSSGVVIDADVKISSAVNIQALNTYEAALKYQDFETYAEVFDPEKKLGERIIQENAEGLISQEVISATSPDDYMLMVRGEGVDWNAMLLTNNIRNLFVTGGDEKNSDSFLTGKNLTFASIEEAVGEVDSVIAELGISVCEPVVYTLDYEKMKQAADGFNNSFVEVYGDFENFEDFEPIEWKHDNECYVLHYQLTLDGMPVSMYENGMYGDGSYTHGTSITVFYSKDGIIYFYLPYEFDKSFRVIDTKKGIDINGAVELLDNKYNSIIMEGEYIVTGIEFEYVPLPVKGEKNLFTLVPAWRFNTTHNFELSSKDGSGNTVPWTDSSSIVFNAIDGSEIITDLGGI